jgi:hypothetical protein
MSAESESVYECEKNFVDPNPKKIFSDPQHCLGYPVGRSLSYQFKNAQKSQFFRLNLYYWHLSLNLYYMYQKFIDIKNYWKMRTYNGDQLQDST